MQLHYIIIFSNFNLQQLLDTGITKQLRKRTLREPNVSSEASKGAESNVVDLNSTQSAGYAIALYILLGTF